jgi:glycosyltransferase involved in cell wall biosynthesis
VVLRLSGDGTEKILKKFGTAKNFTVMIQKGQGLANASNIGIKKARGNNIIRLDADDIFLPGILDKEQNALDENPECGFVYPDYYYNMLPSGKKIIKLLPQFEAQELRSRGDFLSGGTMYRRSVFEQAGYFDETLKTLESYDFILRLLAKGIKAFHIAEPLFEYTIHGSSMSDDVELALETGKLIAQRYGIIYKRNMNHPREIPSL